MNNVPFHSRPSAAAVCFAAPFAVWIALQTALPPTAPAYAFRSAAAALAGLISIFLMRGLLPDFLRGFFRQSVVGVLAGAAVSVLWIAPEYSSWYQTWLVLPFGAPPAPASPSPYEPAVCGWPLTVAKLLGSAFVIAPAEEFFFRSFLYRRLQNRDFLSVPLSRFDLSAFLWSLALFTLEHNRPVVAALAGAAYAALAIRFGTASAVVAHITTNFALGLHVIVRNEWWFW